MTLWPESGCSTAIVSLAVSCVVVFAKGRFFGGEVDMVAGHIDRFGECRDAAHFKCSFLLLAPPSSAYMPAVNTKAEETEKAQKKEERKNQDEQAKLSRPCRPNS